MSSRDTSAPLLLVMSPDEAYPNDPYLAEILLSEGYNCYQVAKPEALRDAQVLADPAVALLSAGALARLPHGLIQQALVCGARLVLMQPPRDWAPHLGLGAHGETYSVARDAYLRVNDRHPWLQHFPALDLQVPGENHVYPNASAEVLTWTAGQLGLPSPFPATAVHRAGEGVAVVFTYDLADCIVRLHQGRPENASTGADPDTNRDGKFTADDLLEDVRDFSLRHVPQADVHQDLMVRVIRGLTADRVPLPRLWHFPRSAPGMVFVNGDGDGMTCEEMQWTADTCDRFGAKFTFYLMDAEISAFPPEAVADVYARGHRFGPHPWAGLRPSVEDFRAEVRGITSRLQQRFGIEPRSVRSHSVIFPGYDDSPRLFAEAGLRLDTNLICGYRFQSGYANSSALPVKFMGRDGQVIDCYEQCTVHGDDVLCSAKSLLPPHNEDSALELSLQVLRDCAQTYHGVFHPYFHPLYLGERGGIPTRRWFQGVLQAARDLHLPCPSADEWLAFNDARRAVAMEDVSWDGAALSFALRADRTIEGLTILLPPCAGMRPQRATMDRSPVSVVPVPHEHWGWSAMQVDLRGGETVGVRIGYGG